MTCKGIWLVFDLDGTITPTPHKAHGAYLPLNESDCYKPMREFLEQDGRLVVVSTAGKRMWRQMHAPVVDVLQALWKRDASSSQQNQQPPVPGRLIFGSYTGATVFYSSGPDGDLVEDTDYRLTRKTTFAPQHVDAALNLLRQVVIKIFAVAAADDTYLPTLSKKYHEVFADLLAARKELGPQKFEDEKLSMKKILQHGEYLKATNDALLDTQIVPGTENVMAHVNVLGVPMKRFGDIFSQDICDTLKNDYGVTARAQPNSVAIAVDGLDKATIIRYMNEKREQLPYLKGFSLSSAVSAGDNPVSVDLPLANFPPMPMVSVSPAGALTSEQRATMSTRMVEVGGEEVGTAVYMQALLKAAASSSSSSPATIIEQSFREVAAALKEKKEEFDKHVNVIVEG